MKSRLITVHGTFSAIVLALGFPSRQFPECVNVMSEVVRQYRIQAQWGMSHLKRNLNWRVGMLRHGMMILCVEVSVKTVSVMTTPLLAMEGIYMLRNINRSTVTPRVLPRVCVMST